MAEAKIREPSFPYITGDGFRDYADYILDEDICNIDIDKLKDWDVIFVKTEFLNIFFKEYQPQIRKKYILITHNSDLDAPGSFSNYLSDPYLVVWFGQNLSEPQNEKLRALPIGLTNRYNGLGDPYWIEQALKKKNLRDKKRKILAYFNVTLGTCFEERKRALDIFKGKSFCKTVTNFLRYGQFLQDLLASRFVISPRGNGLDCHRTWEALYCGAIPVVIRSPIDPLYEDLPVLIVENWNQVNEELLNQKFDVFSSQEHKQQKLYLDYWIELIQSYKNPS